MNPMNGCNEEFSPDPYFSDTCGSEVTCGRCRTCTAHCRCERKPDLARARAITTNLIEELRTLEACRCGHPKHEERCPDPDGCWCDTFEKPAEGWPSPDASREERATFYGCYVSDVETRS